MNNNHHMGNWFRRNLICLVPVVALCFMAGYLLFSTPLAGNIADISRAYADAGVVGQALERAKQNKKLAALMGELQPIGKMAILEGSVRYSKAYDSLNITVRIWGSKILDKMHTKMDVSAIWQGEAWVLTHIQARIKEPSELRQTVKTDR